MVTWGGNGRGAGRAIGLPQAADPGGSGVPSVGSPPGGSFQPTWGSAVDGLSLPQGFQVTVPPPGRPGRTTACADRLITDVHEGQVTWGERFCAFCKQ